MSPHNPDDLKIPPDNVAREEPGSLSLRQTESLLEGITRGTEDMIAAEDTNFRYLYFNDAYRREFEKLWGQELEVGTSMLEAMAPWPEEQKKARELWQRALDGETFSVTTEFGPCEEQMRIYDLRFNPIYDDEGRLFGAAHIFRDVTEQVRIQQALRESEERLRESDRRKDEYLAMLGHELRNPLAAVQSATELVKLAATEDPVLQRASAVLERQSEQMVGLVDGLLEVSRIARGKIRLDMEPLDLGELLDAVLCDRREQFAAKNLELEVSLGPEPMWMSGDALRLTQVFGNLLANAIKFTQAGGRVSVVAHQEDGQAVVRVTDSGVGIRREMLSSIFEPFLQETQDIARSSGGLGLGLALAKNLVELHDGSIEARSGGRGKGAEFELRLPLVDAPSPRQALQTGEQPSPRRLLIVEDNEDAAQMLQELLVHHGHEVVVVACVSRALDTLSRLEVDLVLCDLGLPGKSGFELAEAVRRNPALRDIKLVALTGYGQPEDRRRTHKAGFDEHLTKPVDVRALQTVLGDLAVGASRPSSQTE